MSSVLRARSAPSLRMGSLEALALLGLVLFIVLVHALLLRPGHEWSDDYAMYLSHALNLLSGRPYGDTLYAPNPWGVPGPPTYPPVYPLLIAPLVAWFGPDLHVLKLFDLAMFGAALLAGYALLRERVGAAAALAGVALIGLCPFLTGFRDEVRPDALFLFLFLLTLLLGERWSGQPVALHARSIGRGLMLGAVAYLAYGTRSVGIVLLPALALVEVWRCRRLGAVIVTAGIAWFVLALAQTFTLHADSGYAKLLTLDPHTVLYNAYSYATSLSLLWSNALPAPWGLPPWGLPPC